MEHKKIGRPSKGDRAQIPVRLPRDFAAAAHAEAARRGLTFNDLVGELLAAEIDIPYGTTTEEALPLAKSA